MDLLLKQLTAEEQYKVLQNILEPIMKTEADFIRIPHIIQNVMNNINTTL